MLKPQQFHFFGANVYEWKTSDSLADITDWFNSQKNHSFALWYIPKPNGAVYEIKQYAPQAKGARYLGTYRNNKAVSF